MDWSSLAEPKGKGHLSARPRSPSKPPRRAATETGADGDAGPIQPRCKRQRRPLPRPRSQRASKVQKDEVQKDEVQKDQSLVASKEQKDEEGGETGQNSWEAAVSHLSHQQAESVVGQEGQSSWEAAVSHQLVESVVNLGAAESDQLAGVVEDPEAAESDWRAEHQDQVFGTDQMIEDGETDASQMTALEEENMDPQMTALEEENRLLREKNAVLEARLEENMDPRMTALDEENRLLREKNAVLEARLDVLQNDFLGLGNRVAEIEVFKKEKGKRIKGCEDAIAALQAFLKLKVRGSAGGH